MLTHSSIEVVLLSDRSCRIALLAVVLMTGGCSPEAVRSTAPEASPPPVTGAFALSLDRGALRVTSGRTDSLTAQITRTGTFAGAVVLSAEELPPGVSATFSPAAVTAGATRATLGLTASSASVPGTYTLRVRARADGLSDRTTDLSLAVDPAPRLSVALAAAARTLPQGGSAAIAVTVTRTNFTGPIAWSIAGAPPGVTALVTGAGDAVVLSVATSAATLPGTSVLTVTASGAGVGSASASVALSVVAAPVQTFSVGISTASVELAQGATREVTITIARDGFAMPITLQVGGVPAGVTATLRDVTLSSQSSTTLVLVAASNATIGNTLVTVTARGGSITQAASFSLGVASSPVTAGNVTFDFTSCTGDAIPRWVAAQDGSGAWRQVIASGNAYAFGITTVGGVAWVTQHGADDYRLTLLYGSRSELQQRGGSTCGSGQVGRVVSGTVAGLPSSGFALVSVGGQTATPSLARPDFSIPNVPTGPVDLLAARTSISISTINNQLAFDAEVDKLIIRRVQNPGSGATLAPLDFDGAAAFLPAAPSMAISGSRSGEELTASSSYLSANHGFIRLGDGTLSGTSGTYVAVPSREQTLGDLHLLSAAATTGRGTAQTVIRTATRVFRAAGAQTLALGPSITSPLVATVSNVGYHRPRLVYAVQPEYSDSWVVRYLQAGATTQRAATVAITPSLVTFSTLDFSFPDFRGTGGWRDGWGLRPGVPVSYDVSVSGWTSGVGGFTSPFVEGAIILTAQRFGVYVP